VLGVLAAAVPAGGRILEIGTGAGVGTAWIVAGLGDRTDVELVSLEIDPALSAAVQSWPWPGYVQLVAADALEALDELGTFDVVFADAAPIKYGQIESVLRALRPSGFLLIDDLEAGPGQSEEHTAEKATLQGGVRHHPELQAVILTMSTGATVALASKRLSAEAAPDG
jgi:demethylmenaquinone methyltransferase/2-methoxy-6-polyprenyl-1,4-benzoquinol methylase